MVKSPFNWVGNKYKFLDVINENLKDKSYSMIIDLFMGSGNILFNIDAKSEKYIGNDKQKLLPSVFEIIGQQIEPFIVDELNNILNDWNHFSSNNDYYKFRDCWNVNFSKDNFDRKFVIETALLLKMCSNSMVRFNNDGIFNQGFRGLGKDLQFFKQSMLDNIIANLNELNLIIKERNIKFTNKDFKEYKEQESSDRLLIIDPPYALGDKGMYDRDFQETDNKFLLNLIQNTKNKFLYFNYLEHNGIKNQMLEDLINKNNFKVIEIGDNNVSAGQGKVKNKKFVREVMVTNV